MSSNSHTSTPQQPGAHTSRTRATSLKLKIPPGAQPGDTLELLVGGDSVFVEVPRDARPGETRVVTADVPEFARPPTNNEFGHTPAPPPGRPKSASNRKSNLQFSDASDINSMRTPNSGGPNSPFGRDPDMIYHLGGGLCACCNDWSICCMGTFCHSYLQAQSLKDAGEGNFCTNFVLSLCEHGGGILCLAARIDRVNQKLGGQSDYMHRVLCGYCCQRCTTCQLARAVKKARAAGLLRPDGTIVAFSGGAPPVDAMNR